MLLIDNTYFRKGLMAVPQRQGITEKLDDAIAEYEPEFLKRLLGEELYSDFMSGLNTNPIPVEWKSLQDALLTPAGYSPIANYVFLKFYSDNAQIFVGTADVVPANENSVVAGRYRVVNVWNKMVELNHNVYKFLTTSGFDYSELKGDYRLYQLDNIFDV